LGWCHPAHGLHDHSQIHKDASEARDVRPEVADGLTRAGMQAYEAERAELRAQEQALQALQAKRNGGERLTRDEQLDLRALADMIADTKQRLEPLAAQVAHAQARLGVKAAIAHHNSMVEAKQAWHTQFLGHLGQVVQDLLAFPALDTAQKAPLAALKRPDGRTFPTLGSAEVLQNILSRVPHATVLRDGLLALMTRPITQGDLEAVMDVDSGTKAIEEKTVRRFLEGR
jgi:hypothetical protein